MITVVKKLLWGIFGNDDDPAPPENYLVAQPQWWRNFMWFVVRNPLHNFFFYVIGIQGKDGWVTTGRFPNTVKSERFVEQWPVEPAKFNWVLHSKGWVRLPMISMRIPLGNRGFEFSMGWRPRGAFGGSLRVLKSRIV